MKVYEQAAAAQQAAQGGEAGGTKDDGVVDADFTEVDDDKNNRFYE